MFVEQDPPRHEDLFDVAANGRAPAGLRRSNSPSKIHHVASPGSI